MFDKVFVSRRGHRKLPRHRPWCANPCRGTLSSFIWINNWLKAFFTSCYRKNMLAGDEDEAAIAAPELTKEQQQEAEDRTSVSAFVVHETVRYDGEEELKRPASALAWSGLAAGMSMGFSFVAQALLQSRLPETSWRPLIVRTGYSLGFLIVIIGRQQLFTENTLTAIIPLLARRNLETFAKVLKLWAIVLAANLTGAHLFAWVV